MLIDRARSGSVSDLMIDATDDESQMGGTGLGMDTAMIEEDTVCRTTAWL